MASYREGQYFPVRLVQESIDKTHHTAGWPTVVAQQQANVTIWSWETHLLEHMVHHHHNAAVVVVCETV